VGARGFLADVRGLVLHMASVGTRGLSEHRVPWGNMYEFIAAITCAAVLVLVLGAVRFRAYYLGLFVLLPVVLALAVDVVWIYTPAGQLVPALQSYWIAIHVTAMIIAIGMYIFGAVVTVLYLLPPGRRWLSPTWPWRQRRPASWAGCPGRAPSTGWATAPSCSRSLPGHSR
jgi:ABC-type transport system involved in cytochrome c biogenesis permease subunit